MSLRMQRSVFRNRPRLACCLVLLHGLIACGDVHPAHTGDDDDASADEGATDAGYADGAWDGGEASDAQRPGSGHAGRDAEPTSDAAAATDGGDDVSNDGSDASGDAGGDAGSEEPPDHDPQFAVRKLASGYAHACAITTDGALFCWGQNSFGQLGVDDTAERASPARVGDDDDWTDVTAGRFHTCAIRDGLLYCWGANGFAQLAIPESDDEEPVEEQHAPTLIAEPDRVWTAVSAGDWHTCALDDQGAVYCWGYDLLGRLGNGKGLGTAEDPGEAIAKLTAVDEGAHYLAIDAGASHTCGVREDGALWCWGLGDRGQLGAELLDELGAEVLDSCELNTAPAACSLLPVRVSGGEQWVSVSAGGAHTCALTDDDELFCFGDNQFGQLGTGDDADSTTPSAVEGSYRAASAGTNHTCAVSSNERLVCFGSNESDQLGLDAAMVGVPESVATDATFTDVSSSALCTCAVGSSGAGFCWGTCAYSVHSSPSQVVTM